MFQLYKSKQSNGLTSVYQSPNINNIVSLILSSMLLWTIPDMK